MQGIVEKAKITSKGQITLPKAVRASLGAGVGDSVVFEVRGDRVLVRRDDAEDADPAIQGFLAMLERDIRRGAVAGMPADLEARMREAAKAGDLDKPIEGDVAI